MKIIINKDKLTVEGELEINSGAIQYYEVDVEFDSSWDGLTKKAVIVNDSENSGKEELIINNKVCIEIGQAGNYSIGVVGFRISYRLTTDTEIEINKKYYTEQGVEITSPVLEDISTYFEQYISYRIPTNLQPIPNYKGASDEGIDIEEHTVPSVNEWEIYIAQIQAMCNQSYTKNETDDLLENKVDKVNGKGLSTNDYTTIEKNKLEILHNYDDTEVKGDIADLEENKANKNEIPDVSNFITNSVNNLINYYLKSETYTRQEVLNLIGQIQRVTIQVVQELPQQGESNIIYFVPKEGTTNDIYDEYIWVNNAWEHIGSTEVDLTGYATEIWVNSQISDFLTSSQISTLITNSLTNYYTKTQNDNLLATKNNVFQVEDFPEIPNARDIYQYMGTDIEYKWGHFYTYNDYVPPRAYGSTGSSTIESVRINVNLFKEEFVVQGEYSFKYIYDQMMEIYYWVYGNSMVDLEQIGISIIGEPTVDDIITVYYYVEALAGWKEQEIQTGTQFKYLPEPVESLQDKIVQYVGDTVIITSEDDFGNVTEISRKTGSFQKCECVRFIERYILDTTVNSETVGVYYTRRGISRYTSHILPDEYVEGTQYYKKIKTPIFEWVEVPMGKVTQYNDLLSPDDFPLDTIIQYTGQNGIYFNGSFLKSVLIPAIYSVAEGVTCESEGIYYIETFNEITFQTKYREVILPDTVLDGNTFYNKDSDEYRDWEVLQTSKPVYSSSDMSNYEIIDVESNYLLKIYDSEIKENNSEILIRYIDEQTALWLSEHLYNKNIDVGEGYFVINIDTDVLPEGGLYINYLIQQFDIGGILI